MFVINVKPEVEIRKLKVWWEIMNWRLKFEKWSISVLVAMGGNLEQRALKHHDYLVSIGGPGKRLTLSC